MRRSRCFAFLAVVIVAAALLGFASPAAADPQNYSYVGLGDSYTSGPLIPQQQTNPIGCLRSNQNYPNQVFPYLGLPVFRDASCSGARTVHMTESQSTFAGTNPPQFDRLDADTQIVSLGVGGNDIGFSDLALSCFTYNPFSTPCKNSYVHGDDDEISNRIAATAPLVAAVIQGVYERSPAASLYVRGYPAILPHTGNGCFPQMPLTTTDVHWLREKELELNAMIAQVASENGAVYVDMYTPSIPYNACTSASNRWIEPAIPSNPFQAAPVHPNLRGMQGLGGILLQAIYGG